MTLEEYIKKNTGEVIDYDGSYGFQCTDLARDFASKVLGNNYPVHGWAGKLFEQDWGDDWIKFVNTPDFIPQPGDIALWSGPTKYGHIGIVVKADKNKLTILDQNTGTGNGDGKGNNRIRVHEYSYNGIQGFVRYKNYKAVEQSNPIKDLYYKSYHENFAISNNPEEFAESFDGDQGWKLLIFFGRMLREIKTK